ncbi:MAG: hypothetical protein KAH23_03085 [Kiritimatiellae bacterium]|nr:hypothetical protein [Kiritimatiellia bacterium]
MTIIVSKNGSNAKIVKPTGFNKEVSLQEYIHENPESIPINELKENEKLLILKREFPTKSGPIDALAIDKDGEIYIIETKLYQNTDKRRVIAQALDYGAALWTHQVEFDMFLKIVEKDIRRKFKMSFDEKVKEFFEIQDETIDVLKLSIQNNLKDGKLKFIILMDSIDQRLKDLIVYVNQNSKFDIYGVQFEFYQVDNYEIVIPKLFGGEVKKNLSTRSAKILWGENLFFEDLIANVGEKESNIARKILDWYISKGINIKWGTGAKIGTFYPTLEIDGKQIDLLGVFSNGKIEIVFQGYPLNHETKSNLIKDINCIGKISIPEKAADTWSSFPLLYLEDKPVLDRFIKIFEKLFFRDFM